jgi:putative copper export protein
MLSTLGLAVLFGSLVLIVAAWPEGPEYILAVRFIRSVWILATLGAVLYVVALSAGVNEESLGKGLNPSSWLDLLDAGWSGRAALARLVLTLLCGWVVSRPERVIDPTTQLPAIVIPTLAVATIGLSRTGGDLAILGVFAGIAHALAMAVWFGAVVLLTRVVLAGPGDEDLVHAVRGFGRISNPAILVTVITGFIQLFRLDGGNVFTTGHGRLLLIKAVAVAAMVFIGMTTRQVASHRLARASDLSPGTADNLRRAFGTEAMIGVVVLGLSAGLMSFVPAKAPVDQVERFALNIPFADEATGVEIDIRLQPGRVGVNRLRVEVSAPDGGLSGLQVAFVPPADSGLATIEQDLPGLTGAPGQDIADTTPAAGIPLQVAGTWTVEFTGSTATGALPPFVQRFEVRDADGAIAPSDIGSIPAPAAVTSAPTTSTTLPATTAAP